jgi:hypothetical protein
VRCETCFGKFLTRSNRAILSELAEKLSITSGEIVDFGPLELPSSTPQPQPTRESHPNIRFWKKADYMVWKGTAAAIQRNKPRGKLPYLEDAEGNWLDNETVKSVRKLLCVGLNDLFGRGIAPKKWGQATPGAIAYIKKLLECAHPLFTFAEHGWKLDHFIITHYPFWARRKFGKVDGDEELDDADNLSNIDTNDTVDALPSPSSAVPGPLKKRKSSSPSSAAPRLSKKHKASPSPSAVPGSSDEVNHNLPSISALPNDKLCQPETKREECSGDTSTHLRLQDSVMRSITELDLPTDTNSTQLSEAPAPTHSIAELILPTNISSTQSIAGLDLPTDTNSTQSSGAPAPTQSIAELIFPTDTNSMQSSGAPAPTQSIAGLNLLVDTSTTQSSGVPAPIQSIAGLNLLADTSTTQSSGAPVPMQSNVMTGIDPL